MVIAAAFALYVVGMIAARNRGTRWPLYRAVCFVVLGLGSYAWVSWGFLGAHTVDLRWAFSTRIALLLLVVPWLISLGKPIGLARVALPEAGLLQLERLLDSRAIRFIGNAVFEPLFTFGLFMLFLTPLAGMARLSVYAQGGLTVLIPVIGLLTVLPIVENAAHRTSFFITVEFVLAFVAFVFDAIPGILLRINETVLDRVAAPLNVLPYWFPNPLRDQQLSGDMLWFLAELLDVPILIILLVRWTRIDRGEARSLDELTDEEMDALTVAHLRDSRQH